MQTTKGSVGYVLTFLKDFKAPAICSATKITLLRQEKNCFGNFQIFLSLEKGYRFTLSRSMDTCENVNFMQNKKKFIPLELS